MAGVCYVSYLSSSFRLATAKATGLRSRYVLARTLATANALPFAALYTFADRHIGPDTSETAYILKQLGYDSMDAFIAATVPAHIRVPEDDITNATIPSLSESELTQRAKALGRANSASILSHSVGLTAEDMTSAGRLSRSDAPEVVHGSSLPTKTSDMYAFGVMAWEV
jgi:hypothetical protein